MARLSEREKADILADAVSTSMREDFRKLKAGSRKALSADDFLAFLKWSQQFMNEDVSKRGPIKGTKWLL